MSGCAAFGRKWRVLLTVGWSKEEIEDFAFNSEKKCFIQFTVFGQFVELLINRCSAFQIPEQWTNLTEMC